MQEFIKRRGGTLEMLATNAIHSSLQSAWNAVARIKPQSPPQEPDLVAFLVLEGTQLLYELWEPEFKNYGISLHLTGVFCHQTPMVQWQGSNGACELGDLLLCHFHHIEQRTLRIAKLLQVKCIDNAEYAYVPEGNAQRQLGLYTEWPEFEYTRARGLVGQRRFVRPSAPRLGAQYLLIGKTARKVRLADPTWEMETWPLNTAVPADRLVPRNRLPREFVDLLAFVGGDPFDAKRVAHKRRDWSRVVWDMLEASMTTPFTRRRSGQIASPRIVSPPDPALYFTSMRTMEPRSVLADVLTASQAAYFIEARKPEKPKIPPLVPDDPSPTGGAPSIILVETFEPGASVAPKTLPRSGLDFGWEINVVRQILDGDKSFDSHIAKLRLYIEQLKTRSDRAVADSQPDNHSNPCASHDSLW